MDSIKGALRQRGSGSFELRVYAGTDPNSGTPLPDAYIRDDRADSLRERKALDYAFSHHLHHLGQNFAST